LVFVTRSFLGSRALRATRWQARLSPSGRPVADGFLKGTRHLLVDRDPLYTAHFKSILASAGVELLRLPARSPNLNAHAERFVGSIKAECLRHVDWS